MKKYIDENLLNSTIDQLHFNEIAYERYTLLSTYLVEDYTDVTFDISKDGWLPIGAFPRTSGRGDVLIVGYGFGETDDEHRTIDYSKITITFKNLSDTELEGTAKLDVIYTRDFSS